MPSSFLIIRSSEKGLVVECSQTAVSAETAEFICRYTGRNLDWDRVIAIAGENATLPLLERNLRLVMPDLASSEVKERLAAAARESAFRGLRLTGELLKVLSAFEAQRILALPYKGPVVAMQAYGDLALRPFDDIDILVPQRDMPRAHEVMAALGYRPSLAWLASATAQNFPQAIPGEYKYYSADRDAIVELHTERTLRHFPVVPDFDDFARNGVRVSLSGREVLTFCPEDALVALCIHGAKDFWARLIWVSDIAEMIRAHPQLDWDRVRRRAETLRARRMVQLGVSLTRFIPGATDQRKIPLPPDDEAEALVKETAQRVFGQGGEFGDARERFRFRRRCVPGLVSGWRYALRLTTSPAQEELDEIRLPRYAQPLYRLLRPVRLLFKYREAR
jgi:hypothetical protein